MTAAAVRLGLKKELRALAGPWVGCVVVTAILAALGSRHPSLRPMAVPMYCIGVAVLGALSVGAEYNYRTLAVLLAQPVERRALLWLKLSVLGLALAMFAAVATAVLWGDAHVSPLGLIVALPLAWGLFVAPWLTMATRSAIGGALFTMGIPGTVFTASQLLYFVAYKRAAPTAFQAGVLWIITLTLSAIGAVMTWRGFMRLEAIEGAGPGVRLPEWLNAMTARAATAASARRHPVWLLAQKELRLQQLTLVVAALYVLMSLSARWVQPYVLAWLESPSDTFDDIMSAITFFYALQIVLLSGALASAEERQLGALEWQLILPMAAWKQWAVKVGVILTLSLLITLVLPALLFQERVQFEIFRLDLAMWVMVLASGSLYVSSRCTSGLRALVISVAATFAAVLIISLASDLFLVSAALQQRYAPMTVGSALILLFIWRALANHRSVARA